MNAVAQALADPIRRQILRMLRNRPATAGAIASAFPVSRPAVSRHLRVLREAELVCDVAHGREREYHLDLRALAELEAFLRYLRAPTSARSSGPARSATPAPSSAPTRSPAPAPSPASWQRRFDALETEVHRVRKRRRATAAARGRGHESAAQKKETA